MNIDSLDRLIGRWLDGTLDDAQLAELEAELLESAAAREVFWERAAFHGLLVEAARLSWGAEGDALPTDRGEAGAAGRSRSRLPALLPKGRAAAWFAAGLVSALLVAAVSFSRIGPALGPGPAVAPVVRAAVPLATITRTRFLEAVDAVALPVGRAVGAGRLVIRNGGVELTLRNGVVITLEGPADIDLLGDMEAFLHDGSAVVRMPDGADGFRLKTATAELLDLGTEFAVKSAGGVSTEVQVYEGALLIMGLTGGQAPRFPKRLEAGQSARFTAHGPAEPEPIPYSESRFVRRLPADPGLSVAPPASAFSDPAESIRAWGRPQFDAITVHRAPDGIAIDGRLDEWQEGPGFLSFRDGTPACSEWADGRMMYDDTCLYIAARVGDPEPLKSVIDPQTDPLDGWRGGSVQVRVSTDRGSGWPADGNAAVYYAERQMEPNGAQKAAARNPRLAHLTLWYHAASRTPCLSINHGMVFDDLVVNPVGFRGAFTRDVDGKGYVLEYAIPWRLLNCADDPPRAGDRLAAVWQVNWSDADGRMRREHMVEIRNPHEPLRINVWDRAATWGRAEYR